MESDQGGRVAEPMDPIWGILEYQGRSLVWLAQWTETGVSTVRAYKDGRRTIPAKFRAACARALVIPEGDLFLDRSGERQEVAG